MAEEPRIPLLEHEPSETPVFTAANLLRAARIRKGLPRIAVPPGCLLDFDGELLQHLSDTGKAVEDPGWPCFHTRLFRWRTGSSEYGVIGGTIGAPFAVLVAAVRSRTDGLPVPVHAGPSWTTDAPSGRRRVSSPRAAWKGSFPSKWMKDLHALIREADRVVTF